MNFTTDISKRQGMITRIVKVSNTNGHASHMMAVTENCLGKKWPEPLGWKPLGSWEQHVMYSIRKGGLQVDNQGHIFRLVDAQHGGRYAM